MLVNRGWIPADGAQTAFPKIPAPPAGEVTVTGRLKADETTAASGIKDIKGLPDRQIMLINSERAGAAARRRRSSAATSSRPRPSRRATAPS